MSGIYLDESQGDFVPSLHLYLPHSSAASTEPSPARTDAVSCCSNSLALGRLEVHVLWVEPKFRALRIGARLLSECERRAVALGAHSAQLDTFHWRQG